MKILNLCGKTMVSVAVIAAFCDANAATSGRVSAMPERMPTMPVASLTVMGNPAVTTMNQPIVPGQAVKPTPAPTPTPEPTPDPDPKPVPQCPDGGVENSDYTVAMCMDDVLQCINTGALQGGLHDMFNEDVRNSIMNGMKLCQGAVDKCIKDVRIDCRKVYNVSTDVWLDFNSRIVQPEYYNFVLRKTGLTPNQAENTCLLLDRNTYGSSFAAVSDLNEVNTEYNQKVGAYNESLNGTLSKDNPQGVAVNTVGYDGNRGHYARWDAVNGECLVRVAAYNKDKLITNNWLFGAVGDNNPAEVWEKAGSTFTCNKELFDMDSLLNDTRTAAVVGVGGGAVLGGAIGAAAGAGTYAKKHQAYLDAEEGRHDKCKDPEYLKKLGKAIADSHKGSVLSSYAWEGTYWDSDEGKLVGNRIFGKNFDFLSEDFDEDKCKAIQHVHEKVELYKSAISKSNCGSGNNNKIAQAIWTEVNGELVTELDADGATIKITLANGDEKECAFPDGLGKEDLNVYKACLFVPLQIGLFKDTENNPHCMHGDTCVTIQRINTEISEIEGLLKSVERDVKIANGEDANKGAEIGKGFGIGLATGAAAGGLATMITGFVEKSNITCKVGDGLNSVALGKAHTIDSLKDFYVKWNLHLPDTVSPTSAVLDRASWEQACKQFNSKIQDCSKVQINLKDKKGKYTLVPSACKVSGSVCLINDATAKSHGIK